MNSHFPLLLLPFLLLSSYHIRAEYRLYQYSIRSQEGKSQVVTSALDPVSYTAYHGGKSHTQVDLLRTWICPGYTGKKSPCPSPYSRSLFSPLDPPLQAAR